MKPYCTDRSEAVCRSALARGPLTAVTTHTGLSWRFGQRKFCTTTVARVIAAGAAVRVGNEVRAA